MAMKEEGLTEEQALARIWMVDSKGLIVKNRPEGGITEHKERFARDHAPVKTLADVIEMAKPSVLIGKSDLFSGKCLSGWWPRKDSGTWWVASLIN